MFRIYLQRGEGQGVEITLPASMEEMKTAFTWFHGRENEPAENTIAQVYAEGIPYLKECLYQIPIHEKELGELNFLAVRTQKMTVEQLERFGAAVFIRKPDTLADMVNLSCSTEHYRLYPGLETAYELGMYIVTEDDGDELQVDKEGTQDEGEVGERCIRKYGGCFTREGYMVFTGEPAEPFYDGEHLPDPDFENTSPLILSVSIQREQHSIYLPAPAVNLDFWRERLETDSLEEFRKFSVKGGLDGLKERLPCGSSLGELNRLAGRLKTALDSERKQWICLAAFEAEAPAGVEEAVQVVERLEEYHLLESPDSQGITEIPEGAIETPYGYLWNDIHPVPLPGEAETIRLFSPLTAYFFGKDYWGYTEDIPQVWDASILAGYEEEIREALDRKRPEEEKDRGLAIYLHNRLLGRKVLSMFPSVENRDGELWGVLEGKTAGALSPGELEELKEEWEGQCSDGFGEGFEQRPVMTEDGELYVRFWNPGRFQIQTEQEWEESQAQDAGMQMGGL